LDEASPDERRHGALALKLGVVFAMLCALTWALPGVFNSIFLGAAAYCFFLYWYYQPKTLRPRQKEPFQYRTPKERAGQIVKRVFRIIWITSLSIFLFLLVVGIFTEKQEGEQKVSPDTSQVFETDEAAIWNQKGYEFYLNKDYDSALFFYDRILRLEPGNASAWYSRGLVFYDQQEMDKALESFSRAYDSGMRDAFLSHALGFLYDSTGNTARAISFYKEALAMDSSRANIYTRLAELEPSNATRYKKLSDRWSN
jgi:tetratricopeptide (TPR) repeat protein